MGFEAAAGLDLNLCTRGSAEGLLDNTPATAMDDRRKTKLQELVSRLEMERSKIEVFKRELPLCMRLVEDALECVEEELRSVEIRGRKVEDDRKEKMNWLSSAQLWVTDNAEKIGTEEMGGVEADDRPSMESQTPSAFAPYAAQPAFPPSLNAGEKAAMAVPSLSFLPPAAQMVAEGQLLRGISYNAISRVTVASPAAGGAHLILQPQQAQAKKARRSWSPGLHRLFLAALQRLGGAQVATPKQIRELMKVDGLTNDEVKSHLQKYRLHSRRTPAGSPEGPLQLAGSGRAVDSGEEEESESWN